MPDRLLHPMNPSWAMFMSYILLFHTYLHVSYNVTEGGITVEGLCVLVMMDNHKRPSTTQKKCSQWVICVLGMCIIEHLCVYNIK